jgi:AraC-like DNA-binding protein
MHGSVIGNDRDAPFIGVMLSDTGARECVEAAVLGQRRVVHCATAHDLLVRARDANLKAVVCGVRDAYGLPLGKEEKSALAELNVPIVCIVRPVMTDLACIVELVCGGIPALVRLDARQGYSDMVRSLIDREFSPEATAMIIRRIAEDSALRLDPLLVMSIVAGVRRLEVKAFARLAGLPERTLERRLAVSGLPRAVSLLASSLMLHSTWRLEIEGQRVKEAAVAGGFTSRDAFAAFIRRHAGCTLTHLAKPGSFLRLLERFQRELRPTASFRRETKLVATAQ